MEEGSTEERGGQEMEEERERVGKLSKCDIGM